MAQITRRNFLAASAATAGIAGLAACSSTTSTDETETDAETTTTTDEDALAAPDASAYPIEPDGDDVEALYTTETSRKDSWTRATNPNGQTVMVMDEAKIIQVNGYAFRDMNGNGKLDLYEDWRQTTEARAEALASELTADEILPLMFHNGLNSTTAPLDDDSKTTLGEGMRAGVSRAMADSDNYVEAIAWQNAVEEWCEENDPHGIPYMNSTDPYQLYDIPDNHCLVAAFDPDLWKRSGRYTGRAWRATGARVNLGPQIDIGTNVVWTRLGGSICEDPAANRDFVSAFGAGMQSTWGDDECTDDLGWGKDSVAIMCKHYVGAGAVEGGRNDHNDAGKFDVFPGDNFNAHLIPFLDGGLKLDSVTEQMAAVMPNYGIAYSEDGSYGPNYGGAYNNRNIGILRNAGWDGMVTTDWQILRSTDYGDRAHGVKQFTVPERFKMLLEGSVDQVGGDWDLEDATEGYKLYEEEVGEDDALARVRESARRIFTVMLKVDLFDNPYLDREYAKEVLEDEAAIEFGQEASNKSIVMLKNAGNVINEAGITGKPKCYIPQKLVSGGIFDSFDPYFELAIDEEVANELFDVVTDTIGEPTGTSSNFMTGEVTEGIYQDSDCVRADAAALEGCEYVVFPMASPDTGAGEGDTDDEKYLPISLQYRSYTADTARDPSLAGDTLEDGSKENRTYKGKTVSASNESDLDRLLELRSVLPEAKIILIVEATNNAQCFHEIEPSADVILWSWASDGRAFGPAYGRILSGEVEPSALLPCQMPASMEAVEASFEDVPRDLEVYTDSEGNSYDFGFGLNWSGVIDDDRTKTYKAAALTEPETEVVPGEWEEA